MQPDSSVNKLQNSFKSNPLDIRIEIFSNLHIEVGINTPDQVNSEKKSLLKVNT